MVWTLAKPSAEQNSNPGAGGPNTTVLWGTQRNMRGKVQMRLTDVSAISGYQWESVHMTVWLIDQNGNSVGAGHLYKQWGVTPGYTQLGHLGSNFRLIRLKTKLEVVRKGWGGYQEPRSSWAADLRYNEL